MFKFRVKIFVAQCYVRTNEIVGLIIVTLLRPLGSGVRYLGVKHFLSAARRTATGSVHIHVAFAMT